jgi:hypothetical protein
LSYFMFALTTEAIQRSQAFLVSDAVYRPCQSSHLSRNRSRLDIGTWHLAKPITRGAWRVAPRHRTTAFCRGAVPRWLCRGTAPRCRAPVPHPVAPPRLSPALPHTAYRTPAVCGIKPFVATFVRLSGFPGDRVQAPGSTAGSAVLLWCKFRANLHADTAPLTYTCFEHAVCVGSAQVWRKFWRKLQFRKDAGPAAYEHGHSTVTAHRQCTHCPGRAS